MGIKLNDDQNDMTTIDNNEGDLGGERYSRRIAPKNMDDIPLRDRSMSLARTKNLCCLKGMFSDVSDLHPYNVKLIDMSV